MKPAINEGAYTRLHCFSLYSMPIKLKKQLLLSGKKGNGIIIYPEALLTQIGH